jgi:hypothetical protein
MPEKKTVKSVTVRDVDKKLALMEVVSAERHNTVTKRLDRLEMILIGSAGTLIVGMAGIIVTIILKGVAS